MACQIPLRSGCVSPINRGALYAGFAGAFAAGAVCASAEPTIAVPIRAVHTEASALPMIFLLNRCCMLEVLHKWARSDNGVRFDVKTEPPNANRGAQYGGWNVGPLMHCGDFL